MNSPKRLFEYYLNCYEADNSRFKISNINKSKVSHRHYFKEELLITGEYGKVPFFYNKIEDLEKDIQLFKIEKQLYYSSFYLLGFSTNGFSKDDSITAPLILYKAETSTDEEDLSYLSINMNEAIINQNILHLLNPKDENSIDKFLEFAEDYFLSKIKDSFPLIKALEQYFHDIDTSALLEFPQLWSRTKISNHLKTSNRTTFFKVVPAAISILVTKMNNTLKVISDLKTIAKNNDFNTALNDLLFTKNTIIQKKKAVYDTPINHILNNEQQQALRNAFSYTNSIIIGPPGTGKSYTISAIVVDCLLQGKSVLVVSKTKSAVEVIREMLSKNYKLKPFIVHTSGHRYKYSLESRIKKLLSAIYPVSHLNHSKDLLYNTQKEVANVEKKFLRKVTTEIELGKLENKTDKTILESFREFFLENWISLDRRFWELFYKYNDLNIKLEKFLKKFIIQQIQENNKTAVDLYRKDIVNYYSAITSDSFSKFKELANKLNFENLFKAFPIWLAHLPELNAVVPTKKEVFDVVIIDEASQCDIASALPAIYRGKKIIIVGDSSQLKHYSFLAKKQQQKFQEESALADHPMLNYRSKSILDVYLEQVQSNDQISFLKEHYRSSPHIIGFSNSEFYENELQILKSTPDYHFKSTQLIYVNGQRNEKGINVKEANEILKKFDELIKQYDAAPVSIGILSLFSDQSNYLKKVLKDKYELSVLKKFQVLCSTVYNFQGNEKDVMLISLALNKESHHSSFRYANNPNLFNVAITRAKSEQYIFSSIQITDFKHDTLLFRYFSYLTNFNIQKSKKNLENKFQIEVIDALKKLPDIKVYPSYPIAGFVLDILVIYNNKKVCIDLIGNIGELSNNIGLDRYKTLNRIKIFCFPLHYTMWKNENNFTRIELEKFIKSA